MPRKMMANCLRVATIDCGANTQMANKGKAALALIKVNKGCQVSNG